MSGPSTAELAQKMAGELYGAVTVALGLTGASDTIEGLRRVDEALTPMARERCPCCGQVIQGPLGKLVTEGELAGLPVRVVKKLLGRRLDTREKIAAWAAELDERGWGMGMVRGIGPSGFQAVLSWLERPA